MRDPYQSENHVERDPRPVAHLRDGPWDIIRAEDVGRDQVEDRHPSGSSGGPIGSFPLCLCLQNEDLSAIGNFAYQRPL